MRTDIRYEIDRIKCEAEAQNMRVTVEVVVPRQPDDIGGFPVGCLPPQAFVDMTEPERLSCIRYYALTWAKLLAE